MDKIRNPYLHWRKDGYNCFGCAPWNEAGLKLEFFEDGDDIVTYFTPGKEYQSWVNTLHGGIQATLLDEVAGWVVTRKLQTAGVTSNMNIRFRHPAPAANGATLEVRARLREMRHNLAVIDGEIRHEGKLLSNAEIIYFTMPQEKAIESKMFAGCELEEGE